MIRFFYAEEKTNSYYPVPWNWSEDPFPAFRGEGQRYNAFLAVANGFKPWFNTFNLGSNTAMSDDYCKIITTKKGTRLLVPCSRKDDEKILLITARGGFRGGIGKIEAVGGEILWQRGCAMHCTPVAHIIARITDPDGYVRTETGNRSSHGDTEIFSWKGGYFRMDTEEYEAAVDIGVLFATRNTIQQELEACKAKRAEEEASRQARPLFIDKLEDLSEQIKACGYHSPYVFGETYFTEDRQGPVHHLYTEDAVKMVEERVTKAEKDHAMRIAEEKWQPLFVEAVKGHKLKVKEDPWGCRQPGYYSNCVSMWNRSEHASVSYPYSQEGLERFIKDLPKYEE